jgi:hypothetical protein
MQQVQEFMGTLYEGEGKCQEEPSHIGRIEDGFDFLGYHFGPGGPSLAQKTIDNFVAKALRLYELPESAKS